MMNYSDKKGCASVVFLGVIVLAVIIAWFSCAFHYTEYTALTVTDKSYGGAEDGFIIWMEDEAGNQYEFTNQDSLLNGKFNSSTIQGQIKVDCVYNIKTCGWRVPLLSWYENIIEYELIEAKK